MGESPDVRRASGDQKIVKFCLGAPFLYRRQHSFGGKQYIRVCAIWSLGFACEAFYTGEIHVLSREALDFHGLRVWTIFALVFRVFHPKLVGFWVFEIMQSL